MVEGIEPESAAFRRRAQLRQDSLTKPPGSLGRLEEIAVGICAMQRTLNPIVARPSVFVFAADHGVCEEGVNPYPQSVTRQMLANFLTGGAAINAIAANAGADLTLVDVGVAGPALDYPALLKRSVAPGTRNFCTGPAMPPEQAVQAIRTGIECAEMAIGAGSRLLAVGEMGIGNTTVASALCAAMTGSGPEVVCGPGTGADPETLSRKKDAVLRALALHGPHVAEPLSLLSRLGGFEIGAICGVCIGAARHRCPVLIDGFISTAAAAIAVRMNGDIRDYLIASHQSAEPGHRILLELLDLKPLVNLGMRLGEGTGAALAIPIVRAAIATFREMATFESAGVSQNEQQPAS